MNEKSKQLTKPSIFHTAIWISSVAIGLKYGYLLTEQYGIIVQFVAAIIGGFIMSMLVAAIAIYIFKYKP